MITIEISVDAEGPDAVLKATLTASDSAEATNIVIAAIETAEDQDLSRFWVRVTGGPTAASCRHHPLSPGTAGDPRR